MSRTSMNAASVSEDIPYREAPTRKNDGQKTDGHEEAGTSDLRGGLRGRKAGKARASKSTPESSQVRCTELSDEELLVGIRLQSESHFSELYSRYFQRIYNFVFARMRNHAESEEVVQETFLAVFRSIENYRGQSSLLSWIYGIAKNTTNNSIRRAKSQAERIDLADDEDLIPRPSLGIGAPDEQLDLNRFREVLSSRLEGLADWQIEIFELRHFENLSIPEISARTTRSSDAVRSSLYRVKRLFFEAAALNAPSRLAGPSRAHR